MVTFNQENRIPPPEYSLAAPVSRLVERVRHYFDQHPDVTRNEFFLDAVQREIRFREQKELRNRAGTENREGGGTNRRCMNRPVLSAEDIRMHALLAERLAVLHHERHGLWPKFRRFFFGNREVRLPELRPKPSMKEAPEPPR
ncbi:MAG: hypothetical protein ABSG53_11575 [Thermoguttaceae bacterium]